MHQGSFRRRDPLRLPLFDVGALIFRHERQHLQNDITEECPHQIFASPGIQQGHIQYHDIDPLFLGQKSPLILDLLIISPQTIDALDIEQIVFFHFTDQPLVCRSFKILARLFIQIDISLRDTNFL